MSNAIANSPQVVEFATDADLHSWLEEQAPSVSAQTPYLLAHAEDGLVWGRFDEGTLTIANQVFKNHGFPKLRLLTMQQCRIFGQQGEVLLWKYRENWKWRFIDDSEKEKIKERQILWGTHGKKQGNFTLLWDGSQGLKHAVPFTDIALNADELVKPVRLLVHHYIKYEEETGLARIYLSRLVNLFVDN